MQVSVQDECRPLLKASPYSSHWNLQNSEEGLFASKNLLIRFMSFFININIARTNSWIYWNSVFAGWWLQKAEKGNANKEFLCLLPNFSEVYCLGHKENSDHPFNIKRKCFESSTPFICFLLGWIVRDTIDTVVGRLVPISTNKICNCNSYINSWGHKYNTISYWVLWNMFWVYLEHCYLFFTVSLRRPWWGLHAILFFFSFVPFLFNIFLILLNLILL